MNFRSALQELETAESRDVGAGATREDIDKAEAALGISFPPTYREFVRRFGWGGLADLEVFGLGSDVPEYLDVVRVSSSERTEMNPRMPHHLVPVCTDGGGNFFCLDVSVPSRSEAHVVFWSHEGGALQQPEKVSASFGEWLAAQIEIRIAM